MRRQGTYLSIMLVVTMIGASGCGRSSGTKTEAARESVPVKTAIAVCADMGRYLEYVGSIKAQDEAVVYPKVSGKVIEKVREDGDPIERGDPIVYIDRDEVGLTFEKAPVESPLTGTVGRIYVDIGTNVTPQTPIAFVADVSKVDILLNIPEKYLPDLTVGRAAEVMVDAYPGEVFTGTIARISPVLEMLTRDAPIEITVDDERDRLQSGMFARVRIPIEVRKGVPAIMREAVIGREPETFVFVVENGKAVLKKVVLGVRQGPSVEVREGVGVGDRVVVMGQQRLRQGDAVTVEDYQEEGVAPAER